MALRHLQYLDAMGIIQYVARRPLPNALASSVITVQPVPRENLHSLAAPKQVPQTAAAITTKSALVDIKIPELESSKRGQVTVKISPVASLAKSAVVTFQCQIAWWLVDDLLLLVDAPRMSDQQITLLRNILRALKRSDDLPPAQQFSWPLAQRKDRSLEAARDQFQGMLDEGPLKQLTVRQIIILGSAPTRLLQTNEANSARNSRYCDWPVLSFDNLQLLLDEPQRKAGVWNMLLPLVSP